MSEDLRRLPRIRRGEEGEPGKGPMMDVVGVEESAKANAILVRSDAWVDER